MVIRRELSPRARAARQRREPQAPPPTPTPIAAPTPEAVKAPEPVVAEKPEPKVIPARIKPFIKGDVVNVTDALGSGITVKELRDFGIKRSDIKAAARGAGVSDTVLRELGIDPKSLETTVEKTTVKVPTEKKVTDQVTTTKEITEMVPVTRVITENVTTTTTAPDIENFRRDLEAIGASNAIIAAEVALLRKIGVDAYIAQKRTIVLGEAEKLAPVDVKGISSQLSQDAAALQTLEKQLDGIEQAISDAINSPIVEITESPAAKNRARAIDALKKGDFITVLPDGFISVDKPLEAVKAGQTLNLARIGAPTDSLVTLGKLAKLGKHAKQDLATGAVSVDIVSAAKAGQDRQLKALGVTSATIADAKSFNNNLAKTPWYMALPQKAKSAVDKDGVAAMNLEGLKGRAKFNKMQSLGYFQESQYIRDNPDGTIVVAPKKLGKLLFTMPEVKIGPILLIRGRPEFLGTKQLFKERMLESLKDPLGFGQAVDLAYPGLRTQDISRVGVMLGTFSSTGVLPKAVSVLPPQALVAVFLSIAATRSFAEARNAFKSVNLEVPTAALPSTIKGPPLKPLVFTLPGFNVKPPAITSTTGIPRAPKVAPLPGFDMSVREGVTLLKFSQVVADAGVKATGAFPDTKWDKILDDASVAAEKAFQKALQKRLPEEIAFQQARAAKVSEGKLQEAADRLSEAKWLAKIRAAKARDDAFRAELESATSTKVKTSAVFKEWLSQMAILSNARATFVKSSLPSPSTFTHVTINPAITTAFAKELQKQGGLTSKQILAQQRSLTKQGLRTYLERITVPKDVPAVKIQAALQNALNTARVTATKTFTAPSPVTKTSTSTKPVTRTETTTRPVTRTTTTTQPVTRTVRGTKVVTSTVTTPVTVKAVKAKPVAKTTTATKTTTAARPATATATKTAEAAPPKPPRLPPPPPPPLPGVPGFSLPSGQKLRPGVFPRVVRIITGVTTRTVDLDTGSVKTTRTPVGMQSDPLRPSFKVITTDKTKPRKRTIRMGIVKLVVTGQSVSVLPTQRRKMNSRLRARIGR